MLHELHHDVLMQVVLFVFRCVSVMASSIAWWARLHVVSHAMSPHPVDMRVSSGGTMKPGFPSCSTIP